MNDTIVISDSLWHAALRELDPKPVWPDNGRDINPQAESEYPRKLVEAVVEYLAEGLDGCDHSVGICMCASIAVYEELTLNLAGKQTCPGCGGEGFTYDQATYEKAKAEYLAKWDGEMRWDISDSEGYVPCERCDKKGTVPLEEEEVGSGIL
jgi:hypothetical protein